MAKPPLFSGLTGFGAPAPSVPRPTLPTLKFDAPTTTPHHPCFQPQPSSRHRNPHLNPNPPKPAFSFSILMGFNSQQPAAVPPAMESKEKGSHWALLHQSAIPLTFLNLQNLPRLLRSSKHSLPLLFPVPLRQSPATSAISMPGPFVNFGNLGATATTLTTLAIPSSGSPFGNNKIPQAPGTTAAQTTGSLFGALLPSTEVAKPQVACSWARLASPPYLHLHRPHDQLDLAALQISAFPGLLQSPRRRLSHRRHYSPRIWVVVLALRT